MPSSDSPRRLLIPLALAIPIVAATLLILTRKGGPEPGSERAAAGSTPQVAAAARPNSELANAPAATSSSDTDDTSSAPRDIAATTGARAAMATTGSAAAPTPALSGRVVDDLGRAVVGAEVSARIPMDSPLALLAGDTRRDAVTDGFGTFELEARAGQELEFTVEADGFAPFEVTRRAPEDLGTPLEDLVMSPGLILRGRVLGEEGGVLSDAELYLTESDARFGDSMFENTDADLVTGSDGRFEFNRVPVGEWAIAVRVEERPLRVFTGEANSPGPLDTPLELQLPLGGTIRGQVNGLGQRAIADYRVRASSEGGFGARFNYGGQVLTELLPEGRFEFKGLDRSLTYDVDLIPNSSNMMMGRIGMGGKRAETVAARPNGADIQLDYLEGASVSIRIVDAKTGEPIERATVKIGQFFNMREELDAAGNPIRFHRDGVAQFSDLYPAEVDMFGSSKWRVQASATGYVAQVVEDLEIPPSGSTDLGEVRLEQAEKITFLVLDGATNRPVRKAQVRMTTVSDEENDDWTEQFSQETVGERTDTEGRVELASFGSRKSVLRVTKSGFAMYVSEPEVLEPSRERVIELAPESIIEVWVRDAEGQPLDDMGVEHRFDDDIETLSSDRRGRVRFRKLAAGTHAFRLSEGRGNEARGPFGATFTIGDSNSNEWTELTIAAGSESSIDLAAPAYAVLSGRVQAGEEPLDNAQVSLHAAPIDADERADLIAKLKTSQHGSVERDSTNSDGDYELDRVVRGDYLLRAAPDRSELATVVEVDLRRAEQTLDVNVGVTGVLVRVSDSKGDPVMGVRVRIVDAKSVDNETTSGRFVNQGRRRGGPAVVKVGGGDSANDDETDASGELFLEGVLVDSEFALFLEGERCLQTYSKPMRLAAGETKTVEVEVELGGSVEVELTSSGTTTPGFMRVALVADEGEGESIDGWSFGGSDARFESLVPGRYRIEAFENNDFGQDAEQPEPVATALVEVSAGNATNVKLALP